MNPLGVRCDDVRRVVVLRCTKRLLEHLPFQVDNAPPRSTTVLGDWFANVVYIDRKPVVLAVAKHTLLPVLVPLAPASALGERLRTELAGVLGALQVHREAIDREVRAMADMIVATTDHRAIVGTLVDFARMIEVFEGDDWSLRRLALDLAETPCSVLGTGNPRRATVELLSKMVVS